jgi:primosomal protein N' (replication factor Y)
MPGLFPDETPVAFAHVAVERGIDRYPEGLTYGIPAPLEGLQAGERVVVPLGRGDAPTRGYVIETMPEVSLDPDAVKLISRRDDSGARLPGELLELARWISGYYCAPIGMTLTAMLPAAVKRGVGTVGRTLIDLGPEAAPERLPPKQQAVVETLAGLDPRERPIEMRALADRAGASTTGPIRRLVEAGVVTAVHRTTVEAAWTRPALDATVPETLTGEQTTVIDAIANTLDDGFGVHLLFGVTGAGKTEVYIRLIRQVVERGRVAMVLVPEIALTPQTGGRLLGRFPDQRVAVLHSGLTAAQRHQQWALVADGTARIVLGARSAVFAPVPDDSLGLIVVDEEHDGSYKQDQTPRYHGRDVAIRRGQLAGCPVVLGSATPSMESWHNAQAGRRSTLHVLSHRAPGLRLPKVRIVDFAEERKARTDRRIHLIGPMLEGSLRRTLDEGGQALLLLNRRGYASYIACPDQRCGWVMTCDDCDVTMVYHKSRDVPAGGFVRCHHCDREQRLPAVCPDCERRISTFGLGTQRVEEELALAIDGLELGRTLLRLDSDTMRSARDLHHALERFADGTVRVLVGTQMIAKGLDFPGVRLVGVINADTAINLPDFRASERTFQLVSQVAGRSGRGAAAGHVVVQSFNPTVPAIVLAAAHDFPAFARIELEERERCGLPPYTRMARLVVRDADHEACVANAAILADGLRALAAPEIRVRGPAPCPIARIAGRHRQQVEVLAPDAATLQDLLTRARRGGVARPGAGMVVDVDPVALL